MRALILWACLMGSPWAAKVVRLYDAWPSQSIPFRIIGSWSGGAWQGPETSAGDLTRSGPWYEKILPATYNPLAGQNKAAFSTSDWKFKYGANGFGDQSDIDIASILKTSDTVWIVPTPLPDGKPQLYGSRPRQITVMFLNPWPGNPSLQVSGGPWMPMKASNRHAGWSEGFVLGFNTLTATFRSADSSRAYGLLGGQTGKTAPAIDLNTMASGDTVWVRPKPDPEGPPSLSATKPRAKTIMLFNPWVSSKPLERPLISFEGASARKMNGMASHCGWFDADLYERTPKVSFSGTKGSLLGASGPGSTDAIDLAATFAAQDTAWIVAAPSGPPAIRKGYTGETGLCEFALLAATVYDFDSSHADFQKGSSGVKRGMVLPRLGNDRKPLKNPAMHYVVTNDKVTPAVKDTIDNFLQSEWFRPVPGKNTQTCRDIPLTLDSTAGSYLYDNPMYFPVDDFKTLPDGSPNPSYNLMHASDLTQHNFSFCLESHGEFDYRKGQIFRFRGDDDVWFFINNQLVVDLGGVHAAEKDSVRLDDIGYTIKKTELGGKVTWDTTRNLAVDPLIDGRTYPFDFFFCERQTGGSSIMIQTDMNMRTKNGFQLRETPIAPGQVRHDLMVSQTSGQGCQAQTQLLATTGRFFLAGPGFDPRVELAPGTHHGGIVIDAQSGSVLIDSAAMVLPAGSYRIVSRSDLDTTKELVIPFVVPFTAGPRFVAPIPFTGIVGQAFPASVASFNVHGPDSASVRFVVAPAPGLEFYRDSLLTDLVKPGDTMTTGTDTRERRFWIKGVLPGQYTVAIGKGSGDTADRYLGIVFQDKGLRFLDATGNGLAVIPAIDAELGDTVRVRFETFAGGSTCRTCGTRVIVRISAPGIGAPDTVALVDGRGSLLLKGLAAVAGGSLLLTVAEDTASRATWAPISFRVKGPDSAFAQDLDGNGVADAFAVHLHHRWNPGSSLAFGWPDTSMRVTTTKGRLTVGTDSLVVTLAFDSGFGPATRPHDPQGLGLYAWGSEPPQVFAVQDRIPPVPLDALLRYGRDGADDTLVVALSEPVLPPNGPRIVERLGAGGWILASQSGQFLSPGQDTLRLLFPPASAACPAPGDSVRLAPSGDVRDLPGNAPGPSPRSVKVRGGQRPPLSGWLLDRDGDGRPETATMRFAGPVRGSLPSFRFAISTPQGSGTRSGTSSLSDDSSLVRVTFDEPLPYGWTSFGPATRATMDEDRSFTLEDSVAPAILSAALHLTESYTDPDTLVVIASEPMRLDASMPWLVLKNGSGSLELGELSRFSRGDTLFFPLRIDDLSGVKVGDSVRFVATAAVRDTFGNVPSPQAPWRRVTGGSRRPVAQILPPLPLVRPGKDLPKTQSRAIELQGMRRDTTDWAAWSPQTGYMAGDICPRGLCNGPELVLNSPVSLAAYLCDNLGVSVAQGRWEIDSAALLGLERDRLGRARVRLSWDGRSGSGARAGDGIYLLRLIVSQPDHDASVPGLRVTNRVWKMGIGPAKP